MWKLSLEWSVRGRAGGLEGAAYFEPQRICEGRLVLHSAGFSHIPSAASHCQACGHMICQILNMKNCSFLLLSLLPLVTWTRESAWNSGNCTSCCLLSWALLAQRAGEPSLGLLTWRSKAAITWIMSFVFYSPMHWDQTNILYWKPEFIWGFLNLVCELDLLIILGCGSEGLCMVSPARCFTNILVPDLAMAKQRTTCADRNLGS